MLRWHIESKQLQLRYTWKISRNSSDEKTNLFIRVADRRFVGIGEAAPNIRYGETAADLNSSVRIVNRKRAGIYPVPGRFTGSAVTLSAGQCFAVCHRVGLYSLPLPEERYNRSRIFRSNHARLGSHRFFIAHYGSGLGAGFYPWPITSTVLLT